MLQIDAFQWCCINFYQNVQRMKQSLPRELEKHLKKKCWGLLSYYQPEWGTVSRYLLACSFKFSLTFSTFISRHCSALTGNKGCCLVFFFFRFFFFFSESESDGLKNTKLSHLSAQLDKEKKRAESLKETCQENAVLLQRQTQLYLCVRALSINM